MLQHKTNAAWMRAHRLKSISGKSEIIRSTKEVLVLCVASIHKLIYDGLVCSSEARKVRVYGIDATQSTKVVWADLYTLLVMVTACKLDHWKVVMWCRLGTLFAC